MEKMPELRDFQSPIRDDIVHPDVGLKAASSSVEPGDAYDGDEDQLARLGKKQVLKVRHHRPRLIQVPRLSL